MHRVLISGSNGLLGQNLLKQLLTKGSADVLAISKSENVYPEKDGYQFQQIDITNREAVMKLSLDFRPDVIIHAAALTQVDPCELNQELATEVNFEGTRNMVDLASKCKSKIIYISTDFVFDGLSGPYHEESKTNPVSHYGRTKLESENIIKCLQIPWAIVRTILVYGVTPAMSRSNLVLWVKDSLEAGKAIRVVNDQYRMPTLVDDLAWGILQIHEKGKEGVFHLSGGEMKSVYDLAIHIARYFNLDESLISPILSEELKQPGMRPVKTEFILDKAKSELNYSPKNFEEGLSVVQNLLEDLS